MKVVLAHRDKRFAQEQLYSNAVKTSAGSTPCIAARATRPVPTSKSAAKNETLIFIRSLPSSVSKQRHVWHPWYASALTA